MGVMLLPSPPTGVTGNQYTIDINAIVGLLANFNLGTTAPTQGPGASNALVEGQPWFDSSVAGKITLRIYDGTSVWMPCITFTISGGTALPVNLPSPVNATDAASKGYVDGVAAGLSIRDSVRWATAAALAANTYNNGSSGVGATLTANANGALSIDGGSPAVNDRVLVQNEATGANNGLYSVTQAGDGSHPYILTRATDANQASNLFSGIFAFCEGGTVNAGAGFVLTTTGAITVGTTALTFTQFSGAGEISAGTGLSKSGNTLSVATNGVTNSLLAQMGANTIKGNNTGGTANSADLTVAQAQALLGVGSQMPGTTTNDNASAGNVGEYVESVVASGSAVSLVSAAGKDITTISLGAGDWEVSGFAYFTGGTTTTVTVIGAEISTTANQVNGTVGKSHAIYGGGATMFNNGFTFVSAPLPAIRFSLSGTTTIHLAGYCSFTTSTASAFGILRARRVR